MSKEKKPFLVVGIGASAGGLAVLKAFVKALPEKTGMAFIVIQHLDPTHKSMLSELLAKESLLPVQDAEDNHHIEPDRIYVIPPDTYLELKDGKIKLTAPEHARGSRKAIDHCFRSLAQECGDRCAGLVFSGSGSDGTAGLRAIKAAGGLALAQDPHTAEHSSMPLSAMDADVIDKVVSVEDMPALLQQYANHPSPSAREEKEGKPQLDVSADNITEQLEQEKALRDSEERLRMAKESGHLGIFDYDITHNVIQWDQMLKDIWGVAPDAPITLETFFASLHPDDIENTEQAIIASLNPDGAGHYHVVYRVIHPKTKDCRWIEASGQVTFDANEPVRMVGMVMDITPRKALEESLHKAVRELQETDRKKNEFLSILGHELRNPLAVLSNSIEVLNLEFPKAEQLITVMKRSVGTMAKLLDDLLDLNRITQNKVRLDFRPIDISQILQTAVTATRNSWEAKNHHVTLHAHHPLLVNGDPMRLEQIFCNLIINACKYTPESGNIALRADQVDGQVRVQIQDTGVGLEGKMVDKIFEPFFQAPQEDKAASGLGIGLALSKKLAELHGGQITAHSKGRNQGTTFIVQLPVQAQPVMNLKGRTRAKKLAIKPGVKVAVIDDNEDILTTVPLLLETLGCQVKIARNAKDGLQLASEFEPDVMLIDIGLPDRSGHDVAARLRADGWKKLLVAISGYSHKEVREKSKKAGFNYHLAKPATLEALTPILAKAR